MHEEAHEHSGKFVKIIAGAYAGQRYLIEDWWDRLAGKSWGVCDGNPTCLEYAVRIAAEDVSPDDEVVYGKIGWAGKLMHVSQLGDPITPESD